MSDRKNCLHVITLRDGTTRQCKSLVARGYVKPYCYLHLGPRLLAENALVGRYMRQHEAEMFWDILKMVRE